jgi:membrane protein
MAWRKWPHRGLGETMPRGYRTLPRRVMAGLTASGRIVGAVAGRFAEDDGWAIASHMALSALTALFPFLIFVAALGGVVGTPNLRAEIVRVIFESWPPAVAEPIASEVTKVLSRSRPALLTFGAILAFALAANGVEAVRTGINRAYRVRETRPFWLSRLEGLVFVVIGAAALVALSVLIVLWPVLWKTSVRWLPPLKDLAITAQALRYGAAFPILCAAILFAHLHLAAGRRSLAQIWPGALLTFALWTIGGWAIGTYFATFGPYTRTYAGLAGAIAALFFLWFVSVVFLLGAELNAVLIARRTVVEEAGDGARALALTMPAEAPPAREAGPP